MILLFYATLTVWKTYDLTPFFFVNNTFPCLRQKLKKQNSVSFYEIFLKKKNNKTPNYGVEMLLLLCLYSKLVRAYCHEDCNGIIWSKDNAIHLKKAICLYVSLKE